MRVLRIFENNINDRYIQEAVEELRNGNIVIYPTDSLYALAVDAMNKKAVERLCRLKGLNPEKNLLSIVCADLSQASDYVKLDNNAFAVLKEYLPGPYTFVLPSSTRLPKIYKARKTVGLRIPDNKIARALAAAMGNPLLTGSVEVDTDNPEASVEPENLAVTYGGDVSVVIDGGTGGTGLSTIVDLTDSSSPEVIRAGIGDFE